MGLGATLYIRGTVEAVPFYEDVFVLTLGYHVKHPDGSYLHASLERNGQELFAVSECSNQRVVDALLSSEVMPPTSLGVDFPTPEMARRAYELLARGGRVLRPFAPLPWDAGSADVIDRYGVCWYVLA